MNPEFLIAFAVGVFVGSFGYRVWRNTRRDADQRPLAGLVNAGAMSPNEERFTRGGNVNPRPTYPRPPAPLGPPLTDAESRMLLQRAAAAELVAGLADPNSPISRAMARNFGAARRR